MTFWVMLEPQPVQPTEALGQIVMQLVAIQQEQAAVHRKRLVMLQAQVEHQTEVLENLVAWSGSLDGTPPLFPP